MLKVEDIEKSYPKSLKELYTWLLTKVQVRDKIGLEYLVKVSLQSSPRVLMYDFFDSKGYFICIKNISNTITYTIQGPFSWELEEVFQDRKGAEEAAWLKCFEIMEEKL